MIPVLVKVGTRTECLVCQEGMAEAIALVKLLPRLSQITTCEGHLLFLQDFAKWKKDK